MKKVRIWLLAGGMLLSASCDESKQTKTTESVDTTSVQAPSEPIDTIIPADTTSADTTHL